MRVQNAAVAVLRGSVLAVQATQRGKASRTKRAEPRPLATTSIRAARSLPSRRLHRHSVDALTGRAAFPVTASAFAWMRASRARPRDDRLGRPGGAPAAREYTPASVRGKRASARPSRALVQVVRSAASRRPRRRRAQPGVSGRARATGAAQRRSSGPLRSAGLVPTLGACRLYGVRASQKLAPKS
jgi:hypothetical protein